MAEQREPSARLTQFRVAVVRAADFAFAAVYSRVTGKVPAPDVQQVAAAAMTGMVAALNDNHARWRYPSPQPPGATPSDTYGLGISTSPAPGGGQECPR
jgi:hypothetical protein